VAEVNEMTGTKRRYGNAQSETVGPDRGSNKTKKERDEGKEMKTINRPIDRNEPRQTDRKKELAACSVARRGETKKKATGDFINKKKKANMSEEGKKRQKKVGKEVKRPAM